MAGTQKTQHLQRHLIYNSNSFPQHSRPGTIWLLWPSDGLLSVPKIHQALFSLRATVPTILSLLEIAPLSRRSHSPFPDHPIQISYLCYSQIVIPISFLLGLPEFLFILFVAPDKIRARRVASSCCSLSLWTLSEYLLNEQPNIHEELHGLEE